MTTESPTTRKDVTVNSVATSDRLITQTTDGSLVRKLHTMRAARQVFEHERARWIITRIVLTDEVVGTEPAWAIYGRRAR
jgi:hypothetical protein